MNVLFLFLDCLRLDRLPLMRRLRCVVHQPGWTGFANHYSAAHCSDPNFLTILTGGLPDDHGVYTQMGSTFTKPFRTLPVLLQQQGYFTWAYEPVKVPAFYRNGYEQIIYHGTNQVSPVDGKAIKQVLRAAPAQPWFGFMRVMDTHYPYNGKPLPAERTAIPHQYDLAVRHIDRFVSWLVRWVLENYPDTVIVLGADHGESLGDNGLYDHLFTLRDTLVRVPMFLYLPGAPQRTILSLTQHPMLFGIARGATGLGNSFIHEQLQHLPAEAKILHGEDNRPVELISLAGWGAAGREQWKHRSIVADLNPTDPQPLKYSVNWHLDKGAGFELTLTHFRTAQLALRQCNLTRIDSKVQ